MPRLPCLLGRLPVVRRRSDGSGQCSSQLCGMTCSMSGSRAPKRLDLVRVERRLDGAQHHRDPRLRRCSRTSLRVRSCRSSSSSVGPPADCPTPVRSSLENDFVGVFGVGRDSPDHHRDLLVVVLRGKPEQHPSNEPALDHPERPPPALRADRRLAEEEQDEREHRRRVERSSRSKNVASTLPARGRRSSASSARRGRAPG